MENRQASRKQPFANEARLAKNGHEETVGLNFKRHREGDL
jgi:hypothetical protein